MAQLSGPQRGQYVQAMFTQIAPRYDLMNRLMTGGQDAAWRRLVIRRARLRPGYRVLDLGAGTGDLSVEALRQQPACRPLAADFTLAMMTTGRSRPGVSRLGIDWSAADAGSLPLADACCDAVISGYLLRNVSDLPLALSEQYRVLKPGGRLVALDTTPPPTGLLAPFIRFHLRVIIPNLGRLLTGSSEAYAYLPETTEGFLQPEQLANRLQQAGFVQVGFQRLMFGTMAVHWGVKPVLAQLDEGEPGEGNG